MDGVGNASNGRLDNDEVFYGRLQNGRPGCDGASDAQLIYCDGAQTLWVNAAGLSVRTFIGQSVAIRGTLRECGNERYIQLNSIEQTGRCEPQVSGEPEKQNLALYAPPTANTHEQPNISSMATDGNAMSYWHAPGADAWIYIDLGPRIDPDGNGDPAGATFNEARLLWGERYATQYGIYVFDPIESRWARIFQKSDGTPDETISFPRSYGRYVLFQMARSSDVEGGFMLREIELYGVETPNAALGSQPIASSAQPDRPTWQAIDSNEASAWASLPGGVDPNPWIYVRLPATTPLTEFKLLWDGGAMPAFFRVGFYQNGEISVWSQQFQSVNARQRLAWGRPIETDAFYIYTEMLGQAGFVQLQELELYGNEPGVLGSGTLGIGIVDARGQGHFRSQMPGVATFDFGSLVPSFDRFTELLPRQIQGMRAVESGRAPAELR